jgi:hypothetical protein
MAKAISPRCDNCNGTGFLREYAHIHAGRCFTCGGTGRERAKKAKAVKVGFQGAHVLALTDAFQVEHVVAWLEATNSALFLMRDPGTSLVTLHGGA